jgi:hypothetical protein
MERGSLPARHVDFIAAQVRQMADQQKNGAPSSEEERNLFEPLGFIRCEFASYFLFQNIQTYIWMLLMEQANQPLYTSFCLNFRERLNVSRLIDCMRLV